MNAADLAALGRLEGRLGILSPAEAKEQARQATTQRLAEYWGVDLALPDRREWLERIVQSLLEENEK